MAASLAAALDANDVKDDDSLVELLPASQATHLYVYDSVSDTTYLASLADIKQLLVPSPLPVPAAPTFTNFQDTQAGGSVVLVPATGTVLADYLYRVGANGQDQAVPANGVISVGNIDGSVYAYAQATSMHAQGATGTSPVFTSYTAPLPVPVLTFPAVGNKTVGDTPVTLSATSTNTGAGAPPITFTTSNAAVVSIASGVASWAGAGTATLTASQAAGNGYAAATATQTVAVTAVAQPTPVLTFNPPASRQAGDPAFELTATSTNGVTPITFTSSDANVVRVQQNSGNGTWWATPLAAGTVTITAAQVAGNGFGAGSAAKQITVIAGPPSFSQTLNPGDNADTLTWSAPSAQLLYNNPVQAQASAPGSNTMAVFYPAGNQVGQLDYDPLDEGHACAVEVNGTTYYKNAATGQPLTFTNGTITLGN